MTVTDLATAWSGGQAVCALHAALAAKAALQRCTQTRPHVEAEPITEWQPRCTHVDIFILGVLCHCFIYLRCFAAYCRQDLNFENRSSWRQTSPGKPCGNLPQAKFVASSICHVSYFCISHFKSSPCLWEGRIMPCRQKLVCLYRNKAGCGF